jgi:tRNA-dihydrouridine synthase B
MILGLAPMDWVTDYPYRRIVENIFKRHWDTKHTLQKRTEFMSADGYMINPSRLVKHLIKDETEKKLIAQIYWWNIDTLIKTTQDINKKYPGFFGIELNIGCPSPKVLSCGAWAGMMKDKSRTLEYIKLLSESTNLPFSIKTRSWLNEQDKEDQFKFIINAAKYCKTISIHGRTYSQAHNGWVDRDFIYNIKKEVWNDCIIIWNGWINSYEESQLQLGNLDGVMIWQAAISDPRIFTNYIPTKDEKIEISKNHLLLMAAYEIYMNHTRTLYPEMSDQLALNRQNLHINKKYDPNSDEFIDIPSIDFHDYIFPMPDYNTIKQYVSIIEQWIKKWERNMNFWHFEYNISDLRCGIDFRKYVFGYIKWYENTKNVKQALIITKDISEIYNIISTL